MNIFNNTRDSQARKGFAKLMNDGMIAQGMPQFKISAEGDKNDRLIIACDEIKNTNDIDIFISHQDPTMPDLYFNHWGFNTLIMRNNNSGLSKAFGYNSMKEALK